MNAMAYNPRDGITDPFGGREDIRAGIIRAVGDAEVRFDEDALRILRAIRFASTIGFEIEEKTAAAAIAKRSFLSEISGERIAVEWKKLLSGDSAHKVISAYSEIVSEFLLGGKELKLPKEELFMKAPAEIRELSVFALSEESAARAFFDAAGRLRYDNKRKRFGITVLESFGYCGLDSELGARKLLMDIGEECAVGVLEIRQALGLSDEREEQNLRRVIERGDAYRISDLDISGNDIMALKIRGAAVGRVLEALLNAVVCGEVKNERTALMIAAQKIVSLN